MLAALKKYFGYDSFRPYQREIITEILNKRDVFAVMPTGGGKSLCYQLPSVLSKGTTIVISPLIALMKDQVDTALLNGIEAAFLNSSLSMPQMQSVYRQTRTGGLRLLYIAPERFTMEGFVDFLKDVEIGLFAVDEAHCISEWGHDFRPDYLSLSLIKEHFPAIPIAAFTATATSRVSAQIVERLRLVMPYTVRASFDRKNLFYRVVPKDEPFRQTLEFIGRHRGDPGIVYCMSRDSTERMAEFLSDNRIRALPYHAGLTPEERKRNQEAFSKDEVAVIVATIAFGMGIDKSNIRFIVHADLPKNIEGYYQETGRAGRDNEPAECLLLYGRGDIQKMRYFIDKMEDAKERGNAIEKLNRMSRYAASSRCRRRILLGYFNEEYEPDSCGSCDVCVDNLHTDAIGKEDITVDAQIILSAISRTDQRFGAGHIVDIVIGAKTERIRRLGHEKIKTYGAGKGRPKRHWRYIVNELIDQDALRTEGDEYPVLKITQKGHEVMTSKLELYAIRRDAPKSIEKESEIVDDGGLFERLRELRMRIAKEQGVPPFVIFSDKTLNEMVRERPSNIDEMSMVNGVGAVKLERYGDAFAAVIRDFSREDPVESSETVIDDSTPAIIPPPPPSIETSSVNLKDSAKEIYDMVLQGYKPEAISHRSNIGIAGVFSEIVGLFREGRLLNIDVFVTREKRDAIIAFIEETGSKDAKVIAGFVPGISLEEAMLTAAYHERRMRFLE